MSLAPFPTDLDNWINGASAPCSARLAVLQPATGAPLGSCPASSGAECDSAVAAASAAFAGGAWSRAAPQERARVLRRAAALLEAHLEPLAELESRQTGRPNRELRVQLARLPEWLEYFAAMALTHCGRAPHLRGGLNNVVTRVPLGVVVQITPWNHPMLIAVKKLAPALAAGNCVVLKPSELAPLTPHALALIFAAAGLPPGTLNVVHGTGADAGAALVASAVPRRVDITGGTATGRLVAAAAGRNLCAVSAELGGKSPVIVFDDVAPLSRAVNGAAFAAFIAAGQTCVMGSRVLVQNALLPAFLDAFTRKAAALRVGTPFHEDTQVGALISGRHRDNVAAFVDRARAEGAKVLCGGRVPAKAEVVGADEQAGDQLEGFFYLPTVITDVRPDMQVWREEVFGPVVVVVGFADEDEAVRLANDSDFGLGAGVWTHDLGRAHRVADRLEAGLVWVNDHHKNDPASPWGGMKLSGIGRENGPDAFHEYTQTKSVVINTAEAPAADWFEDKSARYS